MISLSSQMALILSQIFNIILNISLKSMEPLQQFLLFMFASIEVKIG